MPYRCMKCMQKLFAVSVESTVHFSYVIVAQLVKKFASYSLK